MKLFNSNFSDPINIGSEERVSINKLVDYVEKIAKIKVNRKYKLNMPKGVNSRSSDNTLIKKVLKWNYTYSLYNGLSETYKWIEDIYLNKDKISIKKFTSK